jgi:purine-binding chemotaxis protein CheW
MTDAKTGEVVRLGLIRIGEIEFAVPAEYLREAIDYPPQLSKLLSSSPHVAGAVDVRDELIAVVDLRHALGLPPCTERGRQIIIVKHRGYVFGVVVDSLGGVVSVPDTACQPIEVLKPLEAPLIRQVVALNQGSRVISILCLEGVMHQTDVPLTKAAPVQDLRQQLGTGKQWSPYLLFECGRTRLAIDANSVDTVINLDGLGTSFTPSQGCMGLVHNESRKLAVLDPLALLALGQSDLSANRQVLVLKVGPDAVGLLINRVNHIQRLNDATIRPVPALAFARPEAFEGMIPVDAHGDFLKISVAALQALQEIQSMASIHGRGASAQAQAKLKAANNEVYLTFKAGVETAALLRQVREILPFPTSFTPIDRPGDARVGLFTHRELTVPIVDLMRLCGLQADPVDGESRLLLVDGEHGTLAFQVERVYAIEHAQWAHAPIATDQLRGLDTLEAAIRTRGLLTLVREGEGQRGVPALNLQALARALEARYRPPEPQPTTDVGEAAHA